MSARRGAIASTEDWRWRAYGHMTHSVRTGEPGFREAHGCGLYEYLERDPEAATFFNESMSRVAAANAAVLARTYDFSATRRVVDVGGDVYVLSWILHDWDDESAARIVARCRAGRRVSGAPRRRWLRSDPHPPARFAAVESHRGESADDRRGLNPASHRPVSAMAAPPTPPATIPTVTCESSKNWRAAGISSTAT